MNINKDNPNKGLSFLYNNSFGRIILKFVVYNSFVSNVVGWFMDRKISTIMINKFIKNHNIDMSEYENVKYKSFNDFFTRKLNNKRIINNEKDAFISPCDSALTYYKINKELIFKVKNSNYSLDAIINDKKLAKEYENGDLLVFRLAPHNYHRYHFIDDGIVVSNKKIKGKFHTVNPIIYDKYEVFKENSREVTVLNTKNMGKVLYIEVGAMLVGKIHNHNIKNFKKLDEKGYFEYGGSTCILVFMPNKIKVDKKILNASKKGFEINVKYGEKIGRISR